MKGGDGVAEKKAKTGGNLKTYILLCVGVVIAVIIFLVPTPSQFTPEGWKVLGLLIPIIFVWATDCVPVGVASVLFLGLVVCFGLVPAKEAFSGFTNHLTWLMVGAFSLAVAMNKTGLSKRLTYLLIARAKGYWGLVISSYIANLVLMAVPSSAARSGILAPILNSVMDTVDRPMKSNFSRFLTYNFCMSTNLFVGIIVLTGGAANGVMLGLYEQGAGTSLSWLEWVAVMAIPTIICTAILILGALVLGGRPEPELVAKVKASTALQEQYKELGKMTLDEKKVIIGFILAVVLWALSDLIGVSPGFSAIIIMGLLFIPGVGVFEDGKWALSKINWTIVLLIGAVMGLGTILTSTGLADSLSTVLFEPIMGPLSQLGVFGIAIGVAVIAFIVHFILPSPNNVSLMTPLLVAWGIGAHVEPAAVLAFCGLLTLMSDKIVFTAYQMPPYFVFLGMDVTDVPRFNQLLMKMFPVAFVGIIIASFVAYGLIVMTGFGI
jgi:anion transporter